MVHENLLVSVVHFHVTTRMIHNDFSFNFFWNGCASLRVVANQSRLVFVVHPELKRWACVHAVDIHADTCFF